MVEEWIDYLRKGILKRRVKLRVGRPLVQDFCHRFKIAPLIAPLSRVACQSGHVILASPQVSEVKLKLAAKFRESLLIVNIGVLVKVPTTSAYQGYNGGDFGCWDACGRFEAINLGRRALGLPRIPCTLDNDRHVIITESFVFD